MDYFPLFLDLKGRDCLVIGGGEIAARKIQQLLKAGAKVTVVAPELSRQVQAWSEAKDILHQQTVYRKEHLQGMNLVIARHLGSRGE